MSILILGILLNSAYIVYDLSEIVFSTTSTKRITQWWSPGYPVFYSAGRVPLIDIKICPAFNTYPHRPVMVLHCSAPHATPASL